MRIVDFELDLPYVKNEQKIELIQKEKHIARSEAIKQDYQDRWKDKRRIFALETRCITAFFARIFRSFNTKDCRKIFVECVEEVTTERIINRLGVYVVQIKYNYNEFLTLNNEDKKKIALDLLMDGIKIIVSNKKWEIEPFEEAYEKIVQAEYKNEWTWQKSVRNKENKFVAKVLLYHEVEKIDIYMRIENKDGREIHKEKLVSEKPDEFAYARYLGTIRWANNDKVILEGKRHDCEFVVDLRKSKTS